MAARSHFIAWFSEIDKNDVDLAGRKGADLGVMSRAGFPLPKGFVVISNAYYDFIRENNLGIKITQLLSTANFDNPKSLDQVSLHIKKIIREGFMSKILIKDIIDSYKSLGGVLDYPLVSVRASTTTDDLSSASFTEQQDENDSCLKVKGDAVLLEGIKESWASLYDTKALFYRHQQKFNEIKIGVALIIQKILDPETSGLMFTIDPVTNDKDKIVIEAVYGLEDLIKKNEENPDRYVVEKNIFSILVKNISFQKLMFKKTGSKDKEIKLPKERGKKQKISDKQIIELAKLGSKLQKHYYFPQEVKWAIKKNKIYIIQTKILTAKKNEGANNQKLPIFDSNLILKGDPASPGISSGPAKIISDANEINKVLAGDVLVVSHTNSDFLPAMKKAAAIVTDKGGKNSHAAIVSAQLGIPAVIDTQVATRILKTENIIMVNGTKGEVYKGGFFTKSKFDKATEYSNLKTATKVYVNLAEPETADKVSQTNVDGVGLLRPEFMIAGIGSHPKKMIRDGTKQVFVDKLAKDLTKFCRAFNPRPVVYTASDFKTNEYRNLAGGKQFEPQESNPILGYRGAFRYIHDPQVFKLELEAIKLVRNKMGYKNLWLMIPFVRTVEEMEKVKKIINESGLERSNTFKLWMMVEIPSNIILMDKFIDLGIDGISIGSNNLAMLILGTDKNNYEIANEFNEMNPACLWAFEHIIKTAHKHKITSCMNGQAISTYPELIRKLIEWGVTSVSVSPDTIESTRKLLTQSEKELLNK